MEETVGAPFIWLCVTNDGASRICRCALELLGLGANIDEGFPTDPKHTESTLLYAHPGVVVRLTRNLDKDRGFVNGAVGIVQKVLFRTNRDIPLIFTVKLSTGVYVLVHPIYDGKLLFLPCTYGYATTIRRSQGGTYVHGAIWFDHSYPPERGYGYVAASRF